MKPEDIETLSFKIIDEEAGPHDYSPEQWRIVQRMIHTSADFEYMDTVRFHPESIRAGLNAIRSGKTILTDTNMAKAGIRKKELEHFGAAVKCFINDDKIKKVAKEAGITRAKAAVEVSVSIMEGGIYVVGNAPTALLQIIELVKDKKVKPALIIGFPVGFVNAAESKAALIEMDCPYISNVGRKGGSNIAASVVNALAILAVKKE